MIEPMIFFGLGFLIASLLGLGIIPLVHNRAVRLTTRRMEATLPVSMVEITADRDQLRAEFAMSTRRLELSVEQLKAKTASQLTELGQKADTINRLKVELRAKTAAIISLEARQNTLRNQMQGTDAEHSLGPGALRQPKHMFGKWWAKLTKLVADFGERSITSDSPRVEYVALRTQIDALKEQVSNYERETEEIRNRLVQERKSAESATAELIEERAKVEKMSDCLRQSEQALMVQKTEAGVFGRRVQETESRLVELSRALAERELECSQLCDKIAAAQKTENDLRAELAAATGHVQRSRRTPVPGRHGPGRRQPR